MTSLQLTPWRRLAVTAAVGALVASLLAGCASSATTSKTSATPVDGGTLQVATNNDVKPSLVLAGNQANWAWESNVFETLTTLDKDMKPQPLLATSWKVASDGLSIDINLRQGVKFSSGRPMTAEDVKYSFETSLNPAWGSQLAFIAKQFTAINVLSDTKLQIKFAQALPNIFDYFEQTVIIDRNTSSGLADGSKVIGTGPFVWNSWDPGTSLKLTRNADYWGTKPHLDEIDVSVITDTTAMVNALRSGRINYAIGLPGIDVAGFKNDSAYRLVSTPGSLYPLGVNVTSAPFDNLKVRQAIQYAIDRKRIISQVFGGLANVTTQFWSSRSPGYDPKLDNAYPYDAKKAAQIIKDAGAVGASVEISVIGFGPNSSAAEIVRNNLAAVGLKPTVKVLELVDYLAGQSSADLGPMFMGLHGLWFGPATLVQQLPSLRTGNPSHFYTPEYKSLVAALTSSTNEGDSARATQALGAYITQQAFALPLVYAPGYVVATPNLHGDGVTARAYALFGNAYLTK